MKYLALKVTVYLQSVIMVNPPSIEGWRVLTVHTQDRPGSSTGPWPGVNSINISIRHASDVYSQKVTRTFLFFSESAFCRITLHYTALNNIEHCQTWPTCVLSILGLGGVTRLYYWAQLSSSHRPRPGVQSHRQLQPVINPPPHNNTTTYNIITSYTQINAYNKGHGDVKITYS